MNTTRDLSLVRLLNIVLRNRRVLVSLPLIGAGLMVVVAFLIPAPYTARLLFVPQQIGGNTTGTLAGLAAQFGIAVPAVDVSGSAEFYQALLQSRLVTERLLKAQDSIEVDGEMKHGTLIDLLGYRGEDVDPSTYVDAMDDLNKRLEIRIDHASGIVTLDVQMPEAQLASDVAAQALDVITEFNVGTRQTQASAERQFVEERLHAARTELREAENRLQAFLAANRQFDPVSPLAFEHDRLLREVQMRQSLVTALAQSFEQARIEEVRNTPVITVVQKPLLPLERDSRRVPLKAALGFVAGIFLACMLVAVNEVVGWSIRDDPDEANALPGRLGAMLRRLGRA